MIESDSLDRIILDNNLLQNGGGLDEIVRGELQKIIMFIFLKIKFSDKIFLQVPQATKQSTQKKPVAPSQARALPPSPPVPPRLSKQSPPKSPLPPPPRPSKQPAPLAQQPAQTPTQQLSKQPEKSWWQWQWWGGGNNKKKLKKNITRLYNCYILSLNQNGGSIIHNELSLKIKKRLNKKITELKNLEGGTRADDFFDELYTKTEKVIRTDNEVKNLLQPMILKILNIDNIFTQYITNILNNIPNFHETLILNIIQQTMRQKKEEIKKEYEKFITNEQIGGKYNNLNLNLEGGLIGETLLIVIAGILIVGVFVLIKQKLSEILKKIKLDNYEHGDYSGWVSEKNTWGSFSLPHGRGRQY